MKPNPFLAAMAAITAMLQQYQDKHARARGHAPKDRAASTPCAFGARTASSATPVSRRAVQHCRVMRLRLGLEHS